MSPAVAVQDSLDEPRMPAGPSQPTVYTAVLPPSMGLKSAVRWVALTARVFPFRASGRGFERPVRLG